MKITRKQLRQLIKEAEGFTLKYNDDPALEGDQSDELPDALQRSIIDKENEENETNEYKMNEKELRDIINEITAEIIAESSINPGDGEFTEEEGLLLQQLSDDAVEEESLENDDSVPFDHQGEGYENDRLDQDEAELEDNQQSTHFSDDPGNDEFMSWSTSAASSMKDSKITRSEDIPSFTDAYGDAELSPYDEYKKGTSPEEYARLVDEYQDGGVWTDKEDFDAGFMSESKEFTFDKFMKDINDREDKIEKNKKELTENDGDTSARLKQKLYQEDWRNSVKFKGNK
jgi:hypothetical protein